MDGRFLAHRSFAGAMRGLAVAAGLLSAVVAASAASDTVEKRSSELKTWWQGPVRYIAKPAEIKAFRGLEADSDRALFIEKFWARRDPSPSTLTNEYRQLFWERVRDANDLFLDSARQGWMTDRGKVYILYGPPSSIEDYIDLRPGGDLQAGGGVIRWLYEGKPGGRDDVDPLVIVPFQRRGGEYKLSYDPKLSSVFFDEAAVRRETPLQRVLERIYATPVDSELSVRLDLGKMQEVPPHAQVILERVEATASYRTVPIDSRVGRFRHPEIPGGVLAVVTVDVEHVSAATYPSVVARFTRHGDGDVRILGDDSFELDDTEGRRVAQARLVLHPGVYDLTVMAVDPMNALPGMVRRVVEIGEPDAERLSLSDVTWASTVEPLRYAALSSYDEPFTMGPYRVVPRFDPRYRPGDTVNLYFEVYGGEPPYRVSYTLQGQEHDESWVTLGQPSEALQTNASQAWGLDTSAGWPAGRYRIVVEVRDAAGLLVSRQMPFTLEATEASAAE